jgi:very-short-patch-repair endonuclease
MGRDDREAVRVGQSEIAMDETFKRARAMRKALTPPEARLWVALKALRNDGFHFRRQAPFRGYILDFVCHSRRLVVEVDGASHDMTAQHDMTRDAVLAREGYRTIRVSNSAVRDELSDVVEGIVRALHLRSPTRASLRAAVPPHEGEGE